MIKKAIAKILKNDIAELDRIVNFSLLILLSMMFIFGVTLGALDSLVLRTPPIQFQSSWGSAPLSYLQFLSLIFIAPIFGYIIYAVKTARSKDNGETDKDK